MKHGPPILPYLQGLVQPVLLIHLDEVGDLGGPEATHEVNVEFYELRLQHQGFVRLCVAGGLAS